MALGTAKNCIWEYKYEIKTHLKLQNLKKIPPQSMIKVINRSNHFVWFDFEV